MQIKANKTVHLTFTSVLMDFDCLLKLTIYLIDVDVDREDKECELI